MDLDLWHAGPACPRPGGCAGRAQAGRRSMASTTSASSRPAASHSAPGELVCVGREREGTMQTLRRGLLAGLLAGLVLAMLNFVTDGTPGRTLPEALHWFGITIADRTISRFAGFFLLVVLRGLIGVIFAELERVG